MASLNSSLCSVTSCLLLSPSVKPSALSAPLAKAPSNSTDKKLQICSPSLCNDCQLALNSSSV